MLLGHLFFLFVYFSFPWRNHSPVTNGNTDDAGHCFLPQPPRPPPYSDHHATAPTPARCPPLPRRPTPPVAAPTSSSGQAPSSNDRPGPSPAQPVDSACAATQRSPDTGELQTRCCSVSHDLLFHGRTIPELHLPPVRIIKARNG